MTAQINWCGDVKCASEIEKAADAHFLGYDAGLKAEGKCICGNAAKHTGYIGKTY